MGTIQNDQFSKVPTARIVTLQFCTGLKPLKPPIAPLIECASPRILVGAIGLKSAKYPENEDFVRILTVMRDLQEILTVHGVGGGGLANRRT